MLLGVMPGRVHGSGAVVTRPLADSQHSIELDPTFAWNSGRKFSITKEKQGRRKMRN